MGKIVTVTHEPCSTSTDDLQLQLSNAEFNKKLTAIKYLDTGVAKVTLGTYEKTAEDMTVRALRVVLDPNDTQQPKDDEEKVCKGTACIGLASVKVAVFRKKAAAGGT
jgi:hypothetical protein